MILMLKLFKTTLKSSFYFLQKDKNHYHIFILSKNKYMSKIKQFLNLLFTKKYVWKFVAYLLLILAFYIFSDFLGVFLLTFIFAYLFLATAEFLEHKILFWLNKILKKPLHENMFFKKHLLNFLIVLIYIVFIGTIIFIISDLVPKLITELSDLPKSIPFLTEPISSITNQLVEIKNFNTQIGGSINEIVSTKNMNVIMDVFSKLKSASVIFLHIILSIILSFVFLIDRFRLKKYLKWIKKSSFSFLYKEYKIIFEKIVKSFGLIFKAQALIAFVNAVLSVLWLIVIWLMHGGSFPYLLTIGLIVFIAWFIPIVWFIISSIPMFIIGYSMIGWYSVIIEIAILWTIIHIIEAYYLNPKIVSSFLEIPVSLTFVILIISEKLFWIAGLLIWVSLFYFMVWIFRDIDKVLKKKNKHIDKSVKN